jgi:hypothetical protein
MCFRGLEGFEKMAVNIHRFLSSRSLFLVHRIRLFLQNSIISRREGRCPRLDFPWKYFSTSSITGDS